MGRNTDGTFRKGESGNRGGRPKDLAKFRDSLKKFDDRAREKLESAIENGEPWALKMFYEYRYGKPAADAALTDLHAEKLSVDIDVARAKLKMLEAGQNPDAQTITVVIPEALKRDDE